MSTRRPDALVDTSVAVALVVADHEHHASVVDQLGGLRLGLAGHAAFETFSVLTRLPPPARRPPAVVHQLLAQNFPASRFLPADAAQRLVAELAAVGVAGGAVYDALVGAAARSHGLPARHPGPACADDLPHARCRGPARRLTHPVAARGPRPFRSAKRALRGRQRGHERLEGPEGEAVTASRGGDDRSVGSGIVTTPMALYLVRHAKAGQRARWDGPDHLRPLSKAGRAQAEGLAAWLANEPISRLLSSPYVRCVQTLEPLAEKLALEIEITEHLAEAIHFGPALDLLTTLPDQSVLCSHGDLIPDIMEALARRGTVIDGAADWRKGSTWVLQCEDGEVIRGPRRAAAGRGLTLRLSRADAPGQTAGCAPLLTQNSFSARCTLGYHTIQPMNGSRNHRPHSGPTGLLRPSRWYIFSTS